MGKPKPEYFWDKNNHKFPFQCEVPHMSQQDLDPRYVQERISFHFMRVPFDKVAHWGFLSQVHLDAFKKLAGIPK